MKSIIQRTAVRRSVLIRRARRVLRWILFVFMSPPRWGRLLKSIDSTWTARIGLLDLTAKHWRSKRLQYLLIDVFLYMPIFLGSVEFLLRLLTTITNAEFRSSCVAELPKCLVRDFLLNYAAKVIGMLQIGIVVSIFFGLTSAIVAMCVDIISVEMIHRIFFTKFSKREVYTVYLGIIQSYPSMSVVVLSACAALAIRVIHLRQNTNPRIFGIAIIVIFLNAVIILAVLNHYAEILAVVILVFFVFVGLFSHHDTSHLRKKTIFAFFTSLITMGLFVISSALTRYSLILDGSVDPMPIEIQSGSLILLICSIGVVVISDYLGGMRKAAIIGGIGIPVNMLATAFFTDPRWSSNNGFGSSFSSQQQLLIILVSVTCVMVGLTLPVWIKYIVFPFEVAWNRIIFYYETQLMGRCFFQYHSALWDERQSIPFDGLVEHLLFLDHHWPEVSQSVAKRLLLGPQRWAVHASSLERVLTTLSACRSPESIADVRAKIDLAKLDRVNGEIVHEFILLSQDINDLLEQWTLNGYTPTWDRVESQLKRIEVRISSASPADSARFVAILSAWAGVQRDFMYRARGNPVEISSPYIVGIPLKGNRTFVGRSDIVKDIVRTWNGNSSAAIYLYGQKRMGKTSLLHNLKSMLPRSIIALFIDLQRLSCAQNEYYFIVELATAICEQLFSQGYKNQIPPISTIQPENCLLDFHGWLDVLSSRFPGFSVLLMFDEFYFLNELFNKNNIKPERFLNLLRSIIQSKVNYRILMAGSHVFSEITHWSSWLNNTKIIKLKTLSPSESNQLIEQPVSGFSLKYHANALLCVMRMTNGHPFLIQSLCDQVILIKNKQGDASRFMVMQEDVERAVAPTLEGAQLALYDIAKQVSDHQRDLLRMLASAGPDGLDIDVDIPIDDWTQLIDRDWVVKSQNRVKFQNELFRLWIQSHNRLV